MTRGQAAKASKKSRLPRDGKVVEYWTIIDTYSPRVQHNRATFYRFCAWKDHPWGKLDPTRGADFENDWAIESYAEPYEFNNSKNPGGEVVTVEGGWHAEGRGTPEWYLNLFGHDRVFVTEKSAKAALRLMLEQRIAVAQEELDDFRAALAAL